jgi:hypothetical protein
LAITLGDAYAVAQQSAGHCIFAKLEDGRQALLLHETDNALAPRIEVRRARHQQRIDALLRQRRKGGVELAVAAGFYNGNPLTDAARRLLDPLPLRRGQRKA